MAAMAVAGWPRGWARTGGVVTGGTVNGLSGLTGETPEGRVVGGVDVAGAIVVGACVVDDPALLPVPGTDTDDERRAAFDDDVVLTATPTPAVRRRTPMTTASVTTAAPGPAGRDREPAGCHGSDVRARGELVNGEKGLDMASDAIGVRQCVRFVELPPDGRRRLPGAR
jgi:hypothetical protein